jgi:hypothetical protein
MRTTRLATVRDKHGMAVARLRHLYRAKGCAMAAEMSLQLFAGMAHL